MDGTKKMTVLIDSHCHLNMLNLEKYDNDISKVIEAAKQNGVEYLLCVGVDLENSKEVIAIAERFDNVWASAGLHPSEKEDKVLSIDSILPLVQHSKVIAVGETGLDYHYNDSGLDVMRENFRVQIRAAHQVKKPLIIHSRSAPEDTITILTEENARDVRGVMHCFTESYEMAKQSMDLGFYISFSGIITFKNATNVVEVVEKVPLERMLIETDAPYLTPVPFRGKPNKPQYVRYVAEKVAEIKGVSYEEVVETTTRNFIDLFSVDIPLNAS